MKAPSNLVALPQGRPRPGRPNRANQNCVGNVTAVVQRGKGVERDAHSGQRLGARRRREGISDAADNHAGHVPLSAASGPRSTTIERGLTVSWSPARSEAAAAGLAGS